MESVEQTHQEAAAIIADAVSELTRRAVKPELEPFRKSLEESVDRWEGTAADFEASVKAAVAMTTDLRQRATALRDAGDGLRQRGEELRRLTEELGERTAALTTRVNDLHQLGDISMRTLTRIDSTVREYAAVIELSRRHEDEFARQLAGLRAASDAHEALLTHSGAVSNAVTHSLRNARVAALVGFAVLFTEALAIGVALLLHAR